VQLDELRDGVTVDGINYGPSEALLDREQASNVWITFAIREGKNREVRNVLRHLGLQVARLIRISFGPFQLGEIAEGAVEEVPTRVLRDQLGEKLAKAAGTDFSAPIVTRRPEPEKPAPAPRREDEKRRSKDKPEKPEKRPRSGEKRLPGRPMRGEGRRDTYDPRDEKPSRRGAPQRGRRKGR
jgi:23S rRNA pseudouridine2605 synthase